ncbi:MAG TPA: hypothetical protein VHO26_02025 [Propionibacteriaceae bacterium]|nr:hypothetical protein [Propionibacteriaceae bacterium]
MFVGGVGFGLTSPALVMPTGAPSTGYYADPSGYYYIQGVNTWQAEYAQVTSATATPKWGDNLLGGSASLKVGSPIRVEMALTSTVVTSLRGFTVIKLDDALDRLSRYGTKATSDGGSGWMGNPATMPARVWTSGATVNIAGPTPVVAAMPGEINATGAIVFGYNWRPQSPGDYTLTFSVPATSGVSISDGATTGTSTSLVVHVNARGGGGGGGHRP